MAEALTTLRRTTTNKPAKTPIAATFSAGNIFQSEIYTSCNSFSDVAGIHQILSRSRKRPRCQAKRETTVAFGNCGLPRTPGPEYIKRGTLN